MAAETKTGFLIDGTIYPMPELDSLNMGEAQILYDLSGITIEDLAPADGETPDERSDRVMDRLKNPGFWRAAMCIAYLREHPQLKTAQAVKLIDTVNQIQARETLAGDDEGDESSEDPLASTNDPAQPSLKSSPTLSEPFGSDSENGSGQQDSVPAATGTGGSDTSSLPSDPLTLVS